jgi:hypothetical protein
VVPGDATLVVLIIEHTTWWRAAARRGRAEGAELSCFLSWLGPVLSPGLSPGGLESKRMQPFPDAEATSVLPSGNACFTQWQRLFYPLATSVLLTGNVSFTPAT